MFARGLPDNDGLTGRSREKLIKLKLTSEFLLISHISKIKEVVL